MNEIKDKIQEIKPEILEEEKIQDGMGKNYRTLKNKYVLKNETIIETIKYRYSVQDAGWRNIKSKNYNYGE